MSIILTTGLIFTNFLIFQSVVLFVLIGISLLAAASLYGDYMICKRGSIFSSGFNDQKLIWGALYANKKQAMLSFFALSTGVFIVFSVGLNRKGFEGGSQILTGTGGYTLWCESSVPIYHNMMTREGREKLALTNLPNGTEILQCLRLNADDASCLNLNKVVTPTVLGVDMSVLAESAFQIDQNIYALGSKEAFKRFQSHTQLVYPALVDATVLIWSLGKKLGDTLYYENDKGQSVAIQLAGTLPNTIFQGHILIDKRFFSEIWEETTGSEVFLLKTAESEKEEVKNLLSQALNEYGVLVTMTNDRLKLFNTVSDTYLTIFMTLGGLGLLLGIVSFIIVIRKTLATRQKEIELFKTLGFTDKKIAQTLYKESRIVPLYAIATGVISSLAGVGISFKNTGSAVWFMALLFTVVFVASVIFLIKQFIKKSITKISYENI
jgi:putative ABC transport system permease protein